MRILNLLLYLLLLNKFSATASTLNRIVGGTEADIKDFPYQLSIRRFNQHICGGALISDIFGLSAAHCFTLPALYKVRVGSNFKDRGGEEVNVNKVILHPERAKYRYKYDIAILKLEHPLKFSLNISPVKLPENDYLVHSGLSGYISGFGDLYNKQNTGSTTLRSAQVFVEDLNSCKIKYARTTLDVDDSMFCAGYNAGERDSCQGDSGGPFVQNDVLYGIVSLGMDCGDPHHPGVYTNVAAYREYIRLNTGI